MLFPTATGLCTSLVKDVPLSRRNGGTPWMIIKNLNSSRAVLGVPKTFFFQVSYTTFLLLLVAYLGIWSFELVGLT